MLRTGVDAGPEKRRKRFTAVPRSLRGAMPLTGTQLDTFRAFFSSDIADGAMAFDFPNPRDTGSTISVVFREPPSWVNDGGDVYRLRLNLEIQP